MSDMPTTHLTTTTKLATTAVDTPPLPGTPFATVPATQLRVGDLIHRPAPDGGHVYVLVARVVLVDGLVQLMLYDSDHPHGVPATYRPDDRVMLACRDLIEPDDGLAAWTDARWRRAHRRGAAFALIDQIRARSVGLPPLVVAAGESVKDVIDRTRGGDPLPPRVLLADEFADLLAVAPVGALVLDVAHPAVRAVLALFARVKKLVQAGGSWNGADVVATLAGWFDELGIDPDRSVTELTGRVVTTARTAAAPTPNEHDGREGFAEVDLDRVADLVRAGGVDCVIDTPGGGVAVLLAGAPTASPAWAFPWAVQLGPGRFAWDAAATGSLRDLRIGPDIPDLTCTVLLRELGAVTEEQIAAAVLTQARLPRPAPETVRD